MMKTLFCLIDVSNYNYGTIHFKRIRNDYIFWINIGKLIYHNDSKKIQIIITIIRSIVYYL